MQISVEQARAASNAAKFYSWHRDCTSPDVSGKVRPQGHKLGNLKEKQEADISRVYCRSLSFVCELRWQSDGGFDEEFATLLVFDHTDSASCVVAGREYATVHRRAERPVRRFHGGRRSDICQQ
jgi:hypothetical protein